MDRLVHDRATAARARSPKIAGWRMASGMQCRCYVPYVDVCWCRAGNFALIPQSLTYLRAKFQRNQMQGEKL